jgi:hypothetical protein
MKLHEIKPLLEITGVGDENVLGRVLSDAVKALKKLKGNSDKEICSLACGLIDTLKSLEANPNILQTDGYSLMQYLQQLSQPNLGKNSLRSISDALSSYSDDTGE